MSTVERKRRERIARIYDAAAKLFAARGFHATRMEDIAAEVDLQKGALYYYFDSKEALLAKLVEERVGVALDALRAIATTEAEPLDKIRKAITSHLVVFQEHADVYRIFNTERLSSINAAAAEVVDTMGRAYEVLWQGILRDGVAAGQLRSNIDPALTVKAIVGMCNSTLIWFRPSGRLSIEKVAAEFSDVVVRGVGAP